MPRAQLCKGLARRRSNPLAWNKLHAHYFINNYTRSPKGYTPYDAHMPKKTEKRSKDCDYLYEAAFVGCLPCVRYFVEEKCVPPMESSDDSGYTAADWASWAISLQEQGKAPSICDIPGCAEVREYLQDQHLQCLQAQLVQCVMCKGNVVVKAISALFHYLRAYKVNLASYIFFRLSLYVSCGRWIGNSSKEFHYP